MERLEIEIKGESVQVRMELFDKLRAFLLQEGYAYKAVAAPFIFERKLDTAPAFITVTAPPVPRQENPQ